MPLNLMMNDYLLVLKSIGVLIVTRYFKSRCENK